MTVGIRAVCAALSLLVIVASGVASAIFEKRGFHVNTVDSTVATKATTVEYPSGKEALAKAVLARVPGAKAVATPDVGRVTLVLGGNGVVAQGVAKSVAAPGATSRRHPSHGGAGRRAPRTHGLGCID